MQTWQTLDSVETRTGSLELRRRGEHDFLITIGGRVLMNSAARRSEEALGELACRPLSERGGARVLVGGLGMGFTLRAALDALPRNAVALVAELQPAVVQWCRGPLAACTGHAVDDPRVRVVCEDVAQVIERAAGGGEGDRFDAILLDLYRGPSRSRGDAFFGETALARTRSALASDGILAVWSEDPDAAFERRLRGAGFATRLHRPGRGGRRHAVYVARANPLSNR